MTHDHDDDCPFCEKKVRRIGLDHRLKSIGLSDYQRDEIKKLIQNNYRRRSYEHMPV